MVAVYSWIGMAASIRPNSPPSAPSALAVTFVRVGLTSMAAEALAIGRRGASRTTSASARLSPPLSRSGAVFRVALSSCETARNPDGFSPGGPSVLTHPQAHPQPQQVHAARSRWIACSTARWSAASSSLSPLPRPSTPAACPGHSIFALSIQSTHTLFPLLGLAHPQRTLLPTHHHPDHSPAPSYFTSAPVLVLHLYASTQHYAGPFAHQLLAYRSSQPSQHGSTIDARLSRHPHTIVLT